MIQKDKQNKYRKKATITLNLQNKIHKKSKIQPILQSMKDTIIQIDSNEQSDSKQRNRSRLLEQYYNCNIAAHANMLKKCITDIDCQYENKFIRKNDKIWVLANLSKVVQKASYKLQKLLLSKNQQIKNSIDLYQAKFQTLSKDLTFAILLNQPKQRVKDPISRNKSFTLPLRNQSLSIKNVNSQPSCSQINPRKTLSSKRVFRVRQYKNNFHQMINNARYVEKLQKVKLESTYAEFFFQKEFNPQQTKSASIEKSQIDKIKAMTNIRVNFHTSHRAQSIVKNLVPRQSQSLSKYLGFQLRKQSYYKPKSKCQNRNNKVFLNL